MKILKLLVILFIISLITSCGSKKKTVSTNETKSTVKIEAIDKTEPEKKEVSVTNEKTEPEKNDAIIVRPNQTTKEYIENFADVAKQKMISYNIPASITLAQGILESGSGNSTLTNKSNNHFGIKCHKEWTGDKVYHDDDEEGECFRVYKKPEESFEDHSQFLLNRSRYASLFKLEPGDYVGWAYGLSAAGYATDKKYPQKLIAYIEKYELNKYDEEVLGKPAKLSVIKKSEDKIVAKEIDKINNSNDLYIVVKGDGLYSIAKKNKLTVEELKSLNNLTSDEISVGQELIVKKPNTEPKSNLTRSLVNANETEIVKENLSLPEFHIVEKSEGLFAISRKYELSVNDLKLINNLQTDELQLGQKIYLKKPITVTQNFVENPIVKDTVDNSKTLTHTVSKGEGLFSISKKYGKSIEEIKQLNKLETDEIKEGQVLIINKALQKTDVEPKNEIINVIEEANGYRIVKQVPSQHIVQQNESLYQIAYKYDLEVPFLRKLNKLTSDNVKPGQILKLKNQDLNVNSNTHTVQKGDTLFSVSKTYNISVEKIIELNAIKDNVISIGQVLKLE